MSDGKIHKKLEQFKQWVNVDITDSPVRKEVFNLIEQDEKKDSPAILKEIDGKYSPYRSYLSELGKTRLDLLKAEKKFSETIYVALAAVKFKKLISKP